MQKSYSPTEILPKIEIQYGGRCRLEFTTGAGFGHAVSVD